MRLQSIPPVELTMETYSVFGYKKKLTQKGKVDRH